MLDAIGGAGDSDAYDPLDPQADCFHPPSIPTLVWRLHSEEEYESWKMEWRVHTDAQGQQHGFWCCGTPGCDGAGFGFDIFPVDDNYVDPDGRDMGHWVEDPPPDPETDFGRPPAQSTPVRCEKCGEVYSSTEMKWWIDGDCPEDVFQMAGWMCRTVDCPGMGFGDDIRPTDPNFIDPDGRRFLRPGEKHLPDPSWNDEDIPF